MDELNPYNIAYHADENESQSAKPHTVKSKRSVNVDEAPVFITLILRK